MSLDWLMTLEAEAAFASVEDLRGGLAVADSRLLLDRVTRDNSSEIGRIADAFTMGVNVALNRLQDMQTCRICGCSEHAACPPTCSWVEVDLCSACVAR